MRSGGACLPGAVTACDDANLCTNDSCDPSKGCLNMANAASCSDGSVCTVGDKCGGAVCLPGIATTCDDGDPCTTDFCDSAKGCQKVNAADKTACGAALWCKFGKCVPVPVCGNTVVEPENGEACDDGNLVPGDGCDPKCKVEPPPAAVGTLVLSNGTDIISLLNAQGAVVDSITYDAT